MADDSQMDPKTHVQREDVASVLKADQGPHAVLSSWAFDDFTKRGDNFVTFVTRLSVRFSLQGQERSTSYIVKINSCLKFSKDAPAFTAAMMRSEVGFYTQLYDLLSSELTAAGHVRLRMPRCLHYVVKEKKELVFLEDLSLLGFKARDRSKGLDPAHLELVVQELARLHGASLLLQAKYPVSDLLDKFDFLKTDWTTFSENGKAFVDALFSNCLSVALEILQKEGGYQRAVEWLCSIKNSSSDVMDRMLVRKAPFAVVCHGDCWTNNFLFRYDEGGRPQEVMMVDLQVCRVASLATDLVYMMYSSVLADREASTHACLATYYTHLCRVLDGSWTSAPFSLQQLQQEYTSKQELGMMWGTLGTSFMMSDHTELPDIQNMSQEDFAAHRSRLLHLNQARLQCDPHFRQMYYGIFQRMKDD